MYACFEPEMWGMGNVTIRSVLNETFPNFGTYSFVPKHSFETKNCPAFRNRATDGNNFNKRREKSKMVAPSRHGDEEHA
ncbi:hypothetical protein AVEN_173447-1, partial [Araneus ventricosus]